MTDRIPLLINNRNLNGSNLNTFNYDLLTAYLTPIIWHTKYAIYSALLGSMQFKIFAAIADIELRYLVWFILIITSDFGRLLQYHNASLLVLIAGSVSDVKDAFFKILMS